MRRIRVGRPFSLKAKLVDVNPAPGLPARHSRRVVVGKEFEGTILLQKDDTAYDAITRRQIVVFLCALGTAFLLAAAALGLYRDDFGLLQSLWNVVGPTLGVMLAYFFQPRKKSVSLENSGYPLASY